MVLDIGSSTVRWGYAGLESPSHVFDSVVGSQRYTPSTTLLSPLKDSLIYDFESLESLWDAAYARSRTVSSEHPLLFTEPGWNPKESREKLIELAFEKYQVPGFFLGRTPVLSSFAAGKSTALVIDVGAATTSVIPVHDGYILKKGIQHQALAGDFISQQIAINFKNQNVPIVPRYLVKSRYAVDPTLPAVYEEYPDRRAHTTDSFHAFQVKKVADEFKETLCQVSETAFNANFLARKATKTFEFPNGYNNAYRIDRFRFPEIIFDPRYIVKPEGSTEPLPNFAPLMHLIRVSLNSVDADLRPLLLTNIVVTGGTSLMPGFVERLYSDLHASAPGVCFYSSHL